MVYPRSVQTLALTLWFSRTQGLECSLGFGNGIRVIPDRWINDGYCDCPLDAADETETNACSGSVIGGWAGVARAADISPIFECPQEPHLRIPLSRLQDGVCDCCDGADEPAGLCKDNCADILAARRAAVEKVRKDYEIGSAKRKQEIEQFQILRRDTLKKLHIADKNLYSIGAAIANKEQDINGMKLDYWNKRRNLVLNTVASFGTLGGSNDSIDGLFAPLTNAELAKFIVYTCQLNGEMENASPYGTCVPLRLAGVDLGLLWENENIDDNVANLVRSETDEQKLYVAQLVHKNARGERVWLPEDSSPSDDRKDRRRLDDYPGDDEDDQYIREDTIHEEPAQENNKDELSETSKAIQDFVQQSLFSRSRFHYVNRANSLVAKIDEIMKDVDSDANEQDNSEVETEPKDLSFDPMAYRMTRSTLKQRQNYIENGFKVAVSASILLNPIISNENEAAARDELIALAGATLFYGNISAAHVWQILNYIVPEFEVSIHDFNEESCVAPLAVLCPAKTVERNGMQIPPLPVIKAGKAVCEKAVEEANAGICASSDEIPSNVPNGFLGYYLVSPRDTQDAIEQAMLAFRSFEEFHSLTDEAEDQLNRLKQQRGDFEKEANELEEMIGGRNESRFGPNGELHSFSNACHSVVAGKYEYEVCVFGKATQKEKGGGATSLGQWAGMEIDHETGEITLKWENGLKCWNGPNRSATVHLRCGTENKILSAEEPDTCRYVLEMVSHLACHERYFEINIV